MRVPSEVHRLKVSSVGCDGLQAYRHEELSDWPEHGQAQKRAQPNMSPRGLRDRAPPSDRKYQRWRRSRHEGHHNSNGVICSASTPTGRSYRIWAARGLLSLASRRGESSHQGKLSVRGRTYTTEIVSDGPVTHLQAKPCTQTDTLRELRSLVEVPGRLKVCLASMKGRPPVGDFSALPEALASFKETFSSKRQWPILICAQDGHLCTRT